MWMTYVDMQAAATMLNLNIKILTTGIAPDTNLICNRCKPSKGFQTENALREHTKTEHDRVETEEESDKDEEGYHKVLLEAEGKTIRMVLPQRAASLK